MNNTKFFWWWSSFFPLLLLILLLPLIGILITPPVILSSPSIKEEEAIIATASIIASSSSHIDTDTDMNDGDDAPDHILEFFWRRHRPGLVWEIVSVSRYNSDLSFIEVRIESALRALDIPHMEDGSLILCFVLLPKRREILLNDYHSSFAHVIKTIQDSGCLNQIQYMNY